jgi:hypothetical protein
VGGLAAVCYYGSGPGKGQHCESYDCHQRETVGKCIRLGDSNRPSVSGLSRECPFAIALPRVTPALPEDLVRFQRHGNVRETGHQSSSIVGAPAFGLNDFLDPLAETRLALPFHWCEVQSPAGVRASHSLTSSRI